MNIAARFEQTSFDSESLDLASHPRSEESRMAVDRDGLSPSLCRSAEPSILLCVLRRPCRSCSLAPSPPPGAATFLSVPRRPPSLPPYVVPPSVGARAFFHSIDLPSAVSLSFHACAALPFRSNDRAREGGREGLAADAARLPPLTPLPFSFPTK